MGWCPSGKLITKSRAPCACIPRWFSMLELSFNYVYHVWIFPLTLFTCFLFLSFDYSVSVPTFNATGSVPLVTILHDNCPYFIICKIRYSMILSTNVSLLSVYDTTPYGDILTHATFIRGGS